MIDCSHQHYLLPSDSINTLTKALLPVCLCMCVFVCSLPTQLYPPALAPIKEPKRLSPKTPLRSRSFQLRKKQQDANRTLDNFRDAYLEEWAGNLILPLLLIEKSCLISNFRRFFLDYLQIVNISVRVCYIIVMVIKTHIII